MFSLEFVSDYVIEEQLFLDYFAQNILVHQHEICNEALLVYGIDFACMKSYRVFWNQWILQL